MFVLTWINDGVSANAAYASGSPERLEKRVREEWAHDCAKEWPDENMEDTLSRRIESGDGSIIFCYTDPVGLHEEIYAQIEKVEII